MDLKILDIASDTDNFRAIKDHTHNSKLKNSLCGDEVKIELIIKNDKIIDFDIKEIHVFTVELQLTYFQKFLLIIKNMN